MSTKIKTVRDLARRHETREVISLIALPTPSALGDDQQLDLRRTLLCCINFARGKMVLKNSRNS